MRFLSFWSDGGSNFTACRWRRLAAGQQLAAEMNLPVAAVRDWRRRVRGCASAETGLFDRSIRCWRSTPPTDIRSRCEQLIRAKQPQVRSIAAHVHGARFCAEARDALRPRAGQRCGRLRAEGGNLLLVRQLFQGKLNADVRVSGDPPSFASIQAGVYRADQIADGDSDGGRVRVLRSTERYPNEARGAFPRVERGSGSCPRQR